VSQPREPFPRPRRLNSAQAPAAQGRLRVLQVLKTQAIHISRRRRFYATNSSRRCDRKSRPPTASAAPRALATHCQAKASDSFLPMLARSLRLPSPVGLRGLIGGVLADYIGRKRTILVSRCSSPRPRRFLFFQPIINLPTHSSNCFIPRSTKLDLGGLRIFRIRDRQGPFIAARARTNEIFKWR
jgi:hypothetical protein